MKRLFAYIRVSDLKQSTGVSLIEQRAIIEHYAARVGAELVQWFEETRTAAKAGRPVFTRMLKLLRAGKAEGVVIHKLDRSTRNYHDWAAIDELLESGIEIHVANDNLDLRSRGGRLAADVQIAVAVDYIRNLREETLKGIHGRLKQGILPNNVGIGYRDSGAGKAKVIDPHKGPLVRRVFELYATGAFTLRDVTAEAKRLGLRNRNGNPLHLQEIHKVLRNPFYVGILRSKRFGLFPGIHVPLVTRAVFDRVQAALDGKFVRRTKRYEFPFRRLLHCKTCSHSLIGSQRKGHVYYRCSTIACPTTSVREEAVEEQIRSILRSITLSADEATLVEQQLATLSADATTLRASRHASLSETLSVVNARLARLTDLLLDSKVTAEEHDARRASLLKDRIRLEQDIAAIDTANSSVMATAERIVGLAKSPELLYESGDSMQKRELLQILMSDCIVTGKTLEFSLREPFAAIANRCFLQTCRQLCDTPRTFSREELSAWGQEWPSNVLYALNRIGLEPPMQSA